MWLAIALAGCMTTSQQPRMNARRPIDLPAPPQTRDDYAARRPSSISPPSGDVGARKKQAESTPLTRADEPAVTREEPRTAAPRLPLPSVPKIDSVPKIEPDDVTVGEPLEMTVSAPARKQVGGTATYRIALRNSSDHAEEGLRLRCKFDDELVFSGSDKREVLQRVEHLTPGEARELALSLSSEVVGPHCCWFVLARSDGTEETEVISRQVCVDFITRQVEIDVIGPTQRTEGSRAEFNVIFSNRSLRTISDVEAVVSFDKALVPKEASAGAENAAGHLVWRLGTLKPLEKVQLQVEFECRTRANRACVSVEVKGKDLANEQEEACLEIIPVPGTLDLQVGDRDDPLEVGKTGAYEAKVQNIGLQPARGIVLEAAIPENIKLRKAHVRDGERVLAVKYKEEEGKIFFDGVDALGPGARLTYTFEVEALRPGPAEFTARLTSGLSQTPVTAAETTMLVEP